MPARLRTVSLLLFCSGLCALVYQVAWLRELRLVFGASTPASAAVLAIFMGGLGVGGAIFGKRADAHPRPLALYATLELFVAAAAAASPALVWLVRKAYTALGGTLALGMTAGTVVRLVLAALVLAAPTLLMGGTLPAATKAVETDEDTSRRHLAALYGMNTLGAVTGAFLSTFVLLELFGTRLTLWVACLLNALVGVVARGVARGVPERAASKPVESKSAETERSAGDREAPPIAPRFVFGAAAVVGFAFFLMELVWYRMLSPLLGGSSYTFGLVLALALLGIGLGGGAYALFSRDAPVSVRAFSITCALEALFVALPFALGDRIAVLALLLRPWGALGFYGHVAAWTLVAAIVVVLPSAVAGFQFPQLVALLGRGSTSAGRHVGLAYAWNTAGAIAGALAGGFGLLPLLTALGAWRAVVVVLAALAIAAIALAQRAKPQGPAYGLPPALVAVLAVVFVIAPRGPTAVWRESPIGAGRADTVLKDAGIDSLEDWERSQRRSVFWEAEGREATVALSRTNGFAFVVNGKSDGAARDDAPTQVMCGLLGAFLVPEPKRALVIGLGTGSTAGWLGRVPSIDSVDVVELEPSILRVARACEPVNAGAMDNPKVHVFIGDGREVVLTAREEYDVISAEPSNPYRAGVSSLFTQDFYRGVSRRLTQRGVFVQWIQGYEIDGKSLRGAFATLASVFPFVETWQASSQDFFLLGTKEPIKLDVPALRARVKEEPYKSALAHAWRVTTLEGVFAHHLAGASFARAIAQQEGPLAINTDDRNAFEFGIARTIGRSSASVTTDELLAASRRRQEDGPAVTEKEVDWNAIEDARITMDTSIGGLPIAFTTGPPARGVLRDAFAAYADVDLGRALSAWASIDRKPQSLIEMEVVAELYADAGDEQKATHYIDKLEKYEPTEAKALLGILLFRKDKLAESADAMAASFESYRTDPWPMTNLMSHALSFSVDLVARDRARGQRIFDALAEPFSVHLLDEQRLEARAKIASILDAKRLCQGAFAPFEPDPPWRADFLEARVRCYEATHDARLEGALRDRARFLDGHHGVADDI